MPQIGKFSTARWVWARHRALSGHPHLAHRVVLDAVLVLAAAHRVNLPAQLPGHERPPVWAVLAECPEDYDLGSFAGGEAEVTRMPTLAASRSGNLPAEVNSFVGRRHELAEIRRLFTLSSLVTLTGRGVSARRAWSSKPRPDWPRRSPTVSGWWSSVSSATPT